MFQTKSPLAFIATSVVTFGFLAQTVVSAPAKPQPASSDQTADRYKSLESLARGLFYLETMYVDPEKVEEKQMIQNALRGVVDHLDPHTMLMPAKAFEQMTIDTQGKFGGVGIIVSQERGKIIVVSPIEDTPAFKAGVKAGDEIIEIDGADVTKLKSSDTVDRMRGDPGSIMKLTVTRKDVKEPIRFKLEREIIKVKSVRGQMIEDTTLYARIASFQENTSDELEALIQKNNPAKLSGMVLD
ncbi:MAG: PDZ domain-containing protein, partial [Pseudomonadota bacterium]